MFDRVQLKENAKGILKGTYWWCLLACVIGGVLGAGSNMQNVVRFTFGEEQRGLLSLASILSLVFTFFVTNVVAVGISYYFIKLYKGNNDISDIFVGFKGQGYTKIVVAMLVKDIYTLLWTLLFIIPGIVKSLAYTMVPYILAENPNIGTKRAIELSNQMTMGSKWDIFVMKLSFLGWYLLGAILLMVGTIFVTPYYNASFAGLYYTLKFSAFEKGIIRPGELPQ